MGCLWNLIVVFFGGCFWAENLVGKGGYSEVYRGELKDGEMVAVKKLTKATNEERREREFLTEIGTIGHVSHTNVSSLLGCCIDNGLYLLFPFSSRGSVASVLHGKLYKFLHFYIFEFYELHFYMIWSNY